MATGVSLYQHPEYQRMLEEWQLYRDLYQGDHDTLVSKYLVKHAAEVKEDADANKIFATRCLRTRYLNLQEILVSLWLSIFFRNPGTADAQLTAMLGDEINNIDGKGSSLFTFVKEVTKYVLNDGKVFVGADAFPLAQGISEARARELGARPFLECWQALDVPDWQLETADSARFGKFNMLRREFEVLQPRARATQEPSIVRMSHELFRESGKFVTQIYRGELDDQGNIKRDPQTNEPIYLPVGTIPTELTEVPVVCIDDESWMKGAAQEILRHFNLRSNLDNTNYHQGYEKLVAVGVNDEQQRIALAANIVACVPENGDLRSIPASQAVGLENAVSGAVQNVFNVGLNQLRQIAADSKASQAEGSQAAEREYTKSLVESELETIETVINHALKFYAEFKGIPNFKGEYHLDKEIEDEDWDQWLRVWGAVRDDAKQLSPATAKAAVKKAIKKLKFDDEDELLAEVEAAKIKVEPQEDPSRQALIRATARG